MLFIRDAKALEIQFRLTHVFFHSCEILDDRIPLRRPFKPLSPVYLLYQFSINAFLMCSEGVLMFNAFLINFLMLLRASLMIIFHSFSRFLHTTKWFNISVCSLQNKYF